MAKKKMPEKYQRWIEARKRYHLSDTHIQMARELGLNPKKFGGLASTKQEPWKSPLPEFIEELYFKHFKRNRPETYDPSSRWLAIPPGRKNSAEHENKRQRKYNLRVRSRSSHNVGDLRVARSAPLSTGCLSWSLTPNPRPSP